ncbi:unnamed protein product [Colias eurytheme]|nr:unnamed protein product [Colias eurytheme]
MDVLWSKEKLLKIFSKSSIRLTVAQGSGDGGVNRCCRLCGGENNLRSFCTSYLWEGAEERYDQLLYNCFGVQVSPSDCMICENCIRQLRNIQRFRALVLSAFASAPSEYSTRHSQMSGRGSCKRKIKNKKRSTVELSKKTTKMSINKRRSRKSFSNNTTEMKRTNIACSMCKQRYPMILPVNESHLFICSRCKQKSAPSNRVCRKCNMIMPSNMLREHLEMHAKPELRGKSRLCTLPKKSTQVLRTESRLTQLKHYCTQCPKKYTNAQHLATHMQTDHRKQDYLCAVCGKNYKTREMLDRHMRMHTGQPIYQCDICLRYFKGKRNFQSHYLTHGR